MLNEVLELYVIRSNDGKFLRSKGYGGYGDSWVTDINKAKVWSRQGPAKAQCTWWFEHYPTYGRPDVWKISGTVTGIVEHKRPAKTKAEREHDRVSAVLRRYKKDHRDALAEREVAMKAMGPNSISVRAIDKDIKDILSSIAYSQKELKTLTDTVAKQKVSQA
jgi:hypothetical protein